MDMGTQLTWVLRLKLGQIIDIFINDNPQVIGLLVRGNGIFGEGLGHDGERRGSQKPCTRGNVRLER